MSLIKTFLIVDIDAINFLFPDSYHSSVCKQVIPHVYLLIHHLNFDISWFRCHFLSRHRSADIETALYDRTYYVFIKFSVLCSIFQHVIKRKQRIRTKK